MVINLRVRKEIFAFESDFSPRILQDMFRAYYRKKFTTVRTCHSHVSYGAEVTNRNLEHYCVGTSVGDTKMSFYESSSFITTSRSWMPEDKLTTFAIKNVHKLYTLECISMLQQNVFGWRADYNNTKKQYPYSDPYLVGFFSDNAIEKGKILQACKNTIW